MSEIMLFPLNSVVFPEGKLKLRVFEPRYQRMVSYCSRNNEGFGVCLVDNDKAESPHNVSMFGTLVKMVDFEKLDDGFLGITVTGIQRFKIRKIWNQVDGLRLAKVEWLDNWPMQDLTPETERLSQHLRHVYKQFSQVSEMYEHCYFDDASWVSQRWLELLPIEPSRFERLNIHPTCDEAMKFLDRAI